MNQQELETYQAQLEQVEQVLKTDPDNPEFLGLVTELKELIALTELAIATTNPTPNASSSTTGGASTSKRTNPSTTTTNVHVFAPGDECLARYSGDEKWYPARITSVSGSDEKRVYSVVFRGYNSTEVVPSNAVKRLPPSHTAHGLTPAIATSNKRKLSKEEEDEREKKKKKNEKKLEVRAAKAKEQDSKKASWQKFANKSVKKGVSIAGVSGNSIFKTPDNPLGKVGVTGSGKGMTEVAARAKHKFEVGEED